MNELQIEQIPVLQDNYIYLIHEPATNLTAVVDPAVAAPVIKRLEAKGWKLTHILNTHHHSDHVGGNLALKDKYQCEIVGNEQDAGRIPGIDKRLKDNENYKFGNSYATVIAIDGHTIGHIAYHFYENKLLFCGDTIFSLGCGRLFEGSPQQMWNSLSKSRN